MTTVTTNAGEIMRRFNSLPAAIQAGIVRGAGRALILAREQVRTGTGIRSRGGSRGLMGRLTSYARADRIIGLDAAIGFRNRARGFPYELAQEFGAKASSGKAMAIPISSKARLLSDAGSGPRQFPGKLFIPPHMHVLAEAYVRGGGIKEIHYALVKSIPPRLKFMRTMQTQLPAISDAIVAGSKEGLASA